MIFVNYEELKNLSQSYEKALATKNTLFQQYALTKDSNIRKCFTEALKGLREIEKLIVLECGCAVTEYQCGNIIYHIVEKNIV